MRIHATESVNRCTCGPMEAILMLYIRVIGHEAAGEVEAVGAVRRPAAGTGWSLNPSPTAENVTPAAAAITTCAGNRTWSIGDGTFRVGSG